MEKTVLICVFFLLLLPTVFIPGNGSAYAAGDMDMGLPFYPGSKQDPANPPINAPHMKNIHIFTSDPFEKVVEWYSQKLGKFQVEHQKHGKQALWDKKTPEGVVMTVTVSTINAPAGKVEITMTKLKMKK